MGELLVLSREEVVSLFTLAEYVTAVEGAFRAYGEGRTLAPTLLHVDAPGGEFHVKAGGLSIAGRSYFGLKANAAFFGNALLGLPTIQGVIYLADATSGTPLAVVESGWITRQRTGAATAVAARYLAAPSARSVTICGTGRQARVQLEALTTVCQLEQAYVWGRTPAAAATYAESMGRELGISVEPIDRIAQGAQQSDIVVTCTPATEPIVQRADVRAGTLVAAVGSDSPSKQELDPTLLAAATVVCDVTAQCAQVGELHHAMVAGVVREIDVHAELGQVVAGLRVGRSSADEIIVFDSTGTALQDVATAAAIYEKAIAAGYGSRVRLSA